MPRLYVVYDTNIYRGISQAEFDDLRRLERDNAVVGIASYSVALEMLHHMTPEDGGFDSSRAGLRKLVAHCRDYVGQYRLTFIAGLDSQIRYARFGVRRVPPEEERADISWLVGAFGPDEDDSAVERFKQVIANVRAYIDSEEESFIDAIWRVIKSEIAPDAEDWTAFHRARKQRKMALADLATSDAERNFGDVLAKRVARPMARLSGPEARELTVSEIASLARWIRNTLPGVVRLYMELMRKILASGLDLRTPENRNLAWDHRIAAEVLAFSALDPGRKVWLITRDGPLNDIARLGDTQGVVHTLAEYRAILESGSLRDV